MSNDVNSIFDKVPMEESGDKGSSSEGKKSNNNNFKFKGDKTLDSDVGNRIDSFSDFVDEDDYGEDDKKGFEGVKVEKDKTPISRVEDEKKTKGEEDKKPKDEESDKNEDDLDKKDEDGQDKVDEKQSKKEAKKSLSDEDKVTVKVDGKDVEVTIADLKNGYSGKEAVSKRFNELHKEKQVFEKSKKQFDQDLQTVKTEINEIKSSFESVVDEFSKNGFLTKDPLKAINTMLDRMNINSYTFNRALFEYMMPEYGKFFDMTEVEQDAFFAKRENEYLRSREKTLSERTKQAQTVTERQRQEFDLIKSAGLTTDQYNELFDELSELGEEGLTVEKVVEFSKVKPILTKAGDIVSKSSKAGDVKTMNSVVEILIRFPDTTEEEILSHIDGKKFAEKVADDLKGKEDFTVKTKKKSSSFMDEEDGIDMEMLMSIRR